MGEILDYIISYEQMIAILKNYYKCQGKDVDVTITNKLDDSNDVPPVVFTTIHLKEASSIGGVAVDSTRIISMHDLKNIITEILEKEGKKLHSLHDDVVATADLGPDFYITNKQFTLKVKEKGKTYTKKLNKKSN